MFVYPELGQRYMERVHSVLDSWPESWEGFSELRPALPDSERVHRALSEFVRNTRIRPDLFPRHECSADFYTRYFCQEVNLVKTEQVDCGFQERSLAIDAGGNIVLCPDFPDVVVAHITEEASVAKTFEKKDELLERLGWPLGICYRCCHNRLAARKGTG